MQELFIRKPLSALHVWVWIPVPLGTSQELMHSMEHRIFLDWKIAALEDETVRHNGMTFWSGIRLEFTIPPSRFAELETALAELFSKPLPKMSFEERERFARELEEWGGDFFNRALDRFRKAFYETNGYSHSWKDEDAIWRSLDFNAVRLVAVGDCGKSDAVAKGGADIWSPVPRPELVFPTLKEEMAEKEEDEDFGFSEPDAGMDYVLLFPSIVENADDFAFHSLLFQFLRIRADIDFRDTGRTYDPVEEDYFEDGFAVSWLHLITSDTSKKLPALPKLPSEKDFEKTRDSLAFQESIYVDQLLYGGFSVLGILPEEGISAISRFRYDEFRERFDRAVSRTSIFWGRGS